MSTPITDRLTDRPAARGPLIVTEDETLAEHLLRLCAAAGTDPQLLSGAPPPRGLWESAPLVLVGDDQSERCAGLTRRAGVLLLGLDLDDCDVWVRAVQLGAEHVIFLPDAQAWLLDRIADAAEGVGAPALTVAVLGGRGGAGSSTLACALAVTAARAGHRTMLIDADPLGGGLDILLGGEETGGLRWPDLAGSRGRVSGSELAKALPSLHRMTALSWDRGDTLAVPPEAMRSVLAAARRRGGPGPTSSASPTGMPGTPTSCARASTAGPGCAPDTSSRSTTKPRQSTARRSSGPPGRPQLRELSATHRIAATISVDPPSTEVRPSWVGSAL